ncbi:coiled-coil domain-containing protein 162-like [Bombina bombina]|uniref:coiled-coil domain-containing protein 162-like n=1 Tax=Bombina bombina TaxID=8345 RepID=UPI00235AB2E3|nr:coiled-coil domain-containing protein 162-like [Bombina bombina]
MFIITYVLLSKPCITKSAVLCLYECIQNQISLSSFHIIESFPFSVSQLCLCDLNDQERSVAHGELVGVQLLMEDILQEKHHFISFNIKGDEEAKQMYPVGDDYQEPLRRGSVQPPFVLHNPIAIFKLLRSFLILWKQLEVFKEQWGKLKLRAENINTTQLYKQFCEQYRDDIFYPTMKAIARQMGQEEEYEGLTMRSQVVLPPKGASEVEIRVRQLEKLLESFEGHMIYEVQKKVARELTLVISERAREERGLPTELWKQPVMKESYSPVRPQIVEKFVQSLMSENMESASEMTFSKEHLKACLTSLACDVMERERSNFESFSMFYENLLRQEHQLLYQKEQVMLAIEADQRQSESSFSKTAETSHELIVEITALRAKLSALEEENLLTKELMKKEVQSEYEALVRSLFATCLDLKSKLDEYRVHMKKQVCELITEVRKEGVESMILLKRKNGSLKDNIALENNLTMQNKLQTLRDENSHLQALVCKLKALNTWKSTSKEGQLRQMLRNAEKEAVKNKKEGLKLKMIVDKEVSLLRQQLSVARTALARTQAENVKVQQQLDKQKQLMNESEHKYSQEIRSREQLDRIKSASMDRLLENMEEKEHRLRSLAEEAERSSKMGHMQQSKIKKEVKQIKCQLMQERSLKLDAFQRVDELQTQVYDLETPSLGNSPTVLRKKSASLLSRCARSATTVSSSWTTAPVNMDPEAFGEYLQYYSPAEIKESDQVERRIQRPKTVPSRCRHKMTAELTPSTSQTILTQLQELRLKTK